MTTIEELNKTMSQCKKCDLWENRKNCVVGSGNVNADIMIIGEQPGGVDDSNGKPFIGKVGDILDDILLSIKILRKDIYLTNLLKCKPSKRKAHIHEMSNCAPYISKQIEIINPKIICCLGSFTMDKIMRKYGLLNKMQPISKIHGKVFKVTTITGPIKIIPLYHPAVGIYLPSMIEVMKEDIKVLSNV